MLQEKLVEEYLQLVKQYYPVSGKILEYCYLKVLDCYIGRVEKTFYYLAIYYPQKKASEVQAQQDMLRELAENMGLIEVVYINANRLVRDPMSQLKQNDPHFWLELYWIATQFSDNFR